MKFGTLISALLCLAGLAAAKSPVETYGSLSVKNNKLVDSAGNPVTLRGMSLFWHMDFGGGAFWNNSTVSYVQVAWHNSVIRAPMGVADGKTGNKGYLNAPGDALLKMHSVVDAAIEAGSYVIVDWHSHEEYTSQATSFFGQMAKEYGNTPNIIWEIFNEPVGSISESYITSVASEIRKYSNNVIIIGSSDWSKHPEAKYGSVDKNFNNLAYTIHFYSDHTFYGTIKTAMDAGHAVFASEWGMSSSSGNSGFVPTSGSPISTWLSTMNDAGVSHCNWSLGNPNGTGKTGDPSETSAALNQGASTAPKVGTNEWTDADLTASGKSIKSYLVSKNPAWTLNDTTTKVTKALNITSSKKTDLVLGADTVDFGASFNKAAPWKVVISAASGGKKTYQGTSVSVVQRHPVLNRDFGSSAWKPGETVTATLTPGGSTVTYTLSTSSNGAVRLTRLHQTRIRWEGTRIFMADGLIAASTPVRVMVRNAQGQILWQKSASMGTYGWVELGESAPRFTGVQFLEVLSEEAIVRSSMAPSL